MQATRSGSLGIPICSAIQTYFTSQRRQSSQDLFLIMDNDSESEPHQIKTKLTPVERHVHHLQAARNYYEW